MTPVILVSQLKGVADMFNLMAAIGFQDNGNDIKAGRGIVQSVARQPGERCLADLALLEGGYGKLRRSVDHGFAGFYLDKDKGVTIFGNNINFATFAAKIPLDNFEAIALQKSCCQFFSATTNAGVFMSPAGVVSEFLFFRAICPSHANT